MIGSGVFDAPPLFIDGAGLGHASARAGVGLHQLRYVLAAAEHGGFRRAARRLGIQQSAVSRRIHELEARLGAQIFERGPHGVQLTAAGQEFVRSAQGAVSELDSAVDRVAEVARGDQSCLRLGLFTGYGGGHLHAHLKRLLEREGDLTFEIVEGEPAGLVASLTAGHLDLGLLLSVPNRLDAQAAWRERLLVAVPSDDPLADAGLVQWPDLAARRLLIPSNLAREIEEIVTRRLSKRAPALIVQKTTPASLARLVALGQGVAVLNEGDASRVSGVVYRPLARSFITIQAVLGRRPEKPALRRLMASLTGDHAPL